MTTRLGFQVNIVMLSLSLCIGIAEYSLGAEFQIAVEQTLDRADITTHEIKSGEVILGISEFGGGYINKLFIPGIGDLLARHAARYGRGGQVSIRDELHGNRYNPTQAGFSDVAGTHCNIEHPSKGVLYIPPRPMTLFNGDKLYDFTEWENLARDPFTQDGGKKDEDKIDESMLRGKQLDEITSEFDFTGSYEDLMDGKTIVIPTFKISYELRFIRMPGHCLNQFGSQAKVYNKTLRIDDISSGEPKGVHPSAVTSLANVSLSSTLRGDKSIWNPVSIFYVDSEGFLGKPSQLGTVRKKFIEKSRLVDFPLIIYATSTDTDKAVAIGYYHPFSHINEFSIVGRSLKDNSIVYEDSRTVSSLFVGSGARTSGMWLVGVKSNGSGLLSRDQTPAGIYEAIRGESYIIVGTPKEIYETSKKIGQNQH